MRIKGTGAVGIGTSTPAAGVLLDVNGKALMTGFQLGTTATAGQVLTTNATGTGTWQALPTMPTTLPPSGAAGGSLTGTYPNPTIAANVVGDGNLTSDAASLAKVTGSGMAMNGSNVGIGTTTAGFPLNFANVLGDKIALWGQSGNYYGFGVQSGLLQIHADISGSDIAFGYGSSGSFTENMRIKGTGAVGIGTSTPASGVKLDVNGKALMTGFQLGTTATAGQVLTTDATGTGTWQALPTVPTTLPPSGTAGGDLTGSYPNPTIGANVVDSSKLASDADSLAQVTGGIASASTTTTSGQPMLNLAGDLYCTDNIESMTPPALDQYNTVVTGHLNGTMYGQSFTAGVTGYSAVDRLDTYGAFSNAVLNIYRGNGIVAANLLYTQSGVSAGAGGVAIVLDYALPQTAGQQYTFTLSGTSIDLYKNTSTSYSGGNLYYDNSEYPNGSLYFMTEVSTLAPTMSPTVTLLTRHGTVGIGGITEPAYTLQVNGSVAGNSAYVNLSDGRMKTNVQTLHQAIDLVSRLRGVSFNWDKSVCKRLNVDDRQHLGFIAQEVQKVLPQVVSTGADGHLSLAYGDVVPVLTEAIKEQQGQISKLQAENADMHKLLLQMQARLAALEAAQPHSSQSSH